MYPLTNEIDCSSGQCLYAIICSSSDLHDDYERADTPLSQNIAGNRPTPFGWLLLRNAARRKYNHQGSVAERELSRTQGWGMRTSGTQYQGSDRQWSTQSVARATSHWCTCGT